MGIIKRIISIRKVLKSATPQDFTKYSAHFSELSFTGKLHRVGALVGDTILLPVLRLYYILRSPETPTRSKLYIMGALGYFILPLDFIPDILPGLLGFSDDLIVVGIILKQVEKHLTPEIEHKAQRMMRAFCPARP